MEMHRKPFHFLSEFAALAAKYVPWQLCCLHAPAIFRAILIDVNKWISLNFYVRNRAFRTFFGNPLVCIHQKEIIIKEIEAKIARKAEAEIFKRKPQGPQCKYFVFQFDGGRKQHV